MLGAVTGSSPLALLRQSEEAKRRRRPARSAALFAVYQRDELDRIIAPDHMACCYLEVVGTLDV